jgi:hypothetical protein
MRDTYGFGVQKTKLGYRLAANGFWKAHRIDVLQVGLSHRTRTRQQVKDAAIIYDGRPYGVLEQKMRKCFRCAASRPATMCVRQKVKWVCMSPDGAAGVCHRDFYTPIDTGYLDVEIANDKLEDAMIIEEIKDDPQEEEQHAKRQAVDNSLAKLTAPNRQLLADLGFVQGVYQVDTDQMGQTWNSAVDVLYLKSLDLWHCRHRVEKLKTVRKAATKLLQECNLRLSAKQKKCDGKQVSTYTVTMSNVSKCREDAQ